MGKFYFSFAWDKIVNLHVCICKNKICIWSDPGVNLPICKYTPVYLRLHAPFAYPSKICKLEYIYMCVFLEHANWTLLNVVTLCLFRSIVLNCSKACSAKISIKVMSSLSSLRISVETLKLWRQNSAIKNHE